ncbi:hypothetical protein JYU34_009478 [Plutella xylostella]|uniref:Uncharacterized protein n=1 Tax=Plutella xylostella TaxID=51655 RepID=A0ABQ7QJR6_PLUXY|nr:hypothetical protein JYU34_009478 [Plutella xylostella]
MFVRVDVARWNDVRLRDERAACDLPQHWLSGAAAPRVNTPPAPGRAPRAPPRPRARTPRSPRAALHVHATHSLFTTATTLCSFLLVFLATQGAPHKHFLCLRPTPDPRGRRRLRLFPK